LRVAIFATVPTGRLTVRPHPTLADWPETKTRQRSRPLPSPPSTASSEEEEEYIRLPKKWFSEPLLSAMMKLVRPPTAHTRRRQLKVELRVPEQIFLDLLKPLETGEVAGLEWEDDQKTHLKPTTEKKTVNRFRYILTKPSLVDRVWRLQERETPRKRPTKGGTVLPYRRGHGSSRLHLSAAAARRGARTDLVSQVTGNVVLELKVPKNNRAMPTLTLLFAVSTMDVNGNIEWANSYAPTTAAALRKQMKHHLQQMAADPEYPTLTHMSTSAGVGTDSVRPLFLAGLRSTPAAADQNSLPPSS
jgi:hypothetical protein